MTAAAVDRWLINHRNRILLGFDAGFWSMSILAFAVLRYLDASSGMPWAATAAAMGIGAALHGSLGWVGGIYSGRHRIGSKDGSQAVAMTALLAAIALQLVGVLWPGGRLIAVSVPAGAGAMAILGTVGARMLWRTVHEATLRPVAAEPILVFGAGEAGAKLVLNMLVDPQSPYNPVGLLDDDKNKRNLRISGVRVCGNRTDLARLARETGARGLVIAVAEADAQLYRTLAEAAREADLFVKVLPPLSTILSDGIGIWDLRDIDISDLLGRPAVQTDVASIAQYLTGERVLVTGAGGSIGSELCRQISGFNPARLYMLDRDESALHALQLSMTGRALLDTDDVILCDIRDPDALASVFATRRPAVVFHAAALKHLPMLEQYPEEAWKTNVIGSRNVLTAAQAVGVQVFVNISTDKAADPTSVLGYSKRIAERLTAGVAYETSDKYLSVRFGNVLGSRGSVLEAFKEQVACGGPVTVTHPDVTRFFMSIPEACELVIQAAAIGRPGEALVLEMGEPMRIVELAEQVIAMSRKHTVEIVFTGLRDGEKLNEDLFGADEVVHPTAHPLVRAVGVLPLARTDLLPGVDWDVAFGIQPGEA